MSKSSWMVLGIVMLVFWQWLIPGIRVANDFPYPSQLNLLSNFNLPQTWSPEVNSGLGGSIVSVLWSWPLNLTFGIGAKLGLNFAILERLMVLLAIGLGWWGMSKLTSKLGTLIYLTNSFIILLIDGGQISLALAYGMLPVCIYFFKKQEILKFSVSALLLSIFDIRIVYFLVFLVSLDWLIFRRELKYIIKTGFITAVLLIGFHAYWLIPAIINKAVTLPVGYASATQVDFLSFANWKHALFFQQPHWYANIFGKIGNLHREFVIFPILAAAAIFLNRKSRETWYWALVLGIAIFLAKGNTWPFGDIYTWLFNNLPGFNLFRDPVKFYFLIALAYSVLIGKLKSFKVLVIASLIMVIFNWPVISNKMTGTFSVPRFEMEYQEINKIIENDSAWSRTLWIPKRYPMGPSDYIHPLSEAVDLGRLRPFTAGTVGKYETTNYLREASYSGQLLSLLGVKYLVYPAMDPLRNDMKIENQLYHATFSGQLANLPWIKSRHDFGSVTLFETEKSQDLFWIAENTLYVVGSDDIYNTGLDLSKNAVIFAEEIPGTQDNNYQVILNRKSELDYMMTTIPQSNFIFPAKKLNNSPNTSGWLASRSLGEGWWKRETTDFLWWRDFIQTKYGLDNQDFDYGGGWAISEGSNKLSLSVNKGMLYARVMSSSRSGEINIFQKDQKIGTINTLIKNPATKTIKLTGYKTNPDRYFDYSKAEFGWHKIGPVSDGLVTIVTLGDINVVNALAILPKDEMPKLPVDTKTVPIIQSAQVEYSRQSSTHYKLKVSGLKKPSMLVFSQSFDPLWKLNNQSPILVYGLLNGFWINNDGEYELNYEPQKYMWMQWIWNKMYN
ncbi:MAG: hypothetical protein Q8L51_00485 [Candidatus Amesbacteria bacterium]|nr:hypothetical protein [Candidatus Amesbacteria bacterium]